MRARLRSGSSGHALTVMGALALAAAPASLLLATSPANAQSALEVGETITDPGTGERLTIISVRDGAVIAEGYRLILINPSVGAMIPDPADANLAAEVTGVSINATTGLVDMVTLADGRTVPVARDVNGQVFPQTVADPLAQFEPLPPADENRNGPLSRSRNGSSGGNGQDGSIIPPRGVGDGGNGTTRTAGSFTFNSDIEVNTGFVFPPVSFPLSGVSVTGSGGRGGSGGDGASIIAIASLNAGDGGNGGNGTALTVNSTSTISTSGPGGLYGLFVRSNGGNGGDGGDGAFSASISNGGDGGRGGNGGTITVNNNAGGNITTRRINAFGIYARSRGGVGGDGGDADVAISSQAGSAGSAGDGGSVFVNNFGKIHTFGASAHGILGQSLGGSGGSGGDATGLVGGSGAGSRGGRGRTVTLDNEAGGFIFTGGADAHGILAQSVGGGGGAAGSSSALVALGNSAGSGKEGGNVTVRNRADATIVTQGDRGFGLFAQSVGGGGGSAGLSAGLVAIGGSGGSGGVGRAARGENAGLISTSGDGAHAIVSQSIGGGGGVGASSAGFVAVGGSGSRGGTGGTSRVDNTGTILTSGDGAHGSLVQSIGGGGGNAGFTGGAIAVGGRGATGGSSSTVTYINRGLVETTGNNAFGVLAQSVGGGGGNGAATGGLIAVGGSASRAGNGGAVNITQGGTIVTEGDDAHGLVAQSIGGGGGNGGLAASGSAFVGVAVGGRGGAGGSSGTVTIDFEEFNRIVDSVSQAFLPLIMTSGDRSIGVVAQSVGGGGGNGGAAYQVTGGLFGAVSVAVGGSAGGGGAGGSVNFIGDVVNPSGNGIILTDGAFSHGVLAQSVGGGGGNGGSAVSVAIAAGAGGAASVAVGVGGRGGSGGAGGNTGFRSGGFIGSSGDFSHGIFAQSVGGGGGNGGFSVTISGAGSDGVAVAIPVGVGGSGGSGGIGGLVDVAFDGDLLTEGAFSNAVLAQSVGGGGGNGGFSIAGGITGSGGVSASVAVGVGGTGGSGGRGGTANNAITGNVMTTGSFATALVTQSVGGSGGNGGYNVSGTLALSGGVGGGVAVGVGGSGGGAGIGGTVNSSFTGDLLTTGAFSNGILSQSVGGGGGNGGLNVSGNIAGGATGGGALAVGIGGSGGRGGNGGAVNADVIGNVITTGAGAKAFIAQSLGGGGGNGALNVSGSLTGGGTGAGAISVGVGGAGGGAGTGMQVIANITGDTTTTGVDADAILAQSVGGGGGNGGINVSAGLTATSTGGTLAVGVGGAGGSGGNGGVVELTVDGLTSTSGDDSAAIIAQSLGGGGGNGGLNVSGGVTLSTATSATIGVGIGGKGGLGGQGQLATLTTLGDTMTMGDRSDAILVQSLGGGGGNGGINVTGAISGSTAGTGALGVGVGGFGGSGGFARTATGNIGGTITTSGAQSTGVTVQSLGGGGGNGALNVSAGIALSSATALGGSVGVGGFGGIGGNGGLAVLTRTGDTQTDGILSNAITVQSLGGGGGNGGLNISGGVSFSGSGASLAGAIGIGGFGASAGNGMNVTANISGSAVANGVVAPTADNTFGFGSLLLPLRLDGSHGILAQSVGGSGGSGGINISGGIGLSGTPGAKSLALGLGGFGGGGGNGGDVDLDATGTTFKGSGDLRAAVFAQSLGGGGGDGALNVSGGIALNGTLTAGVGGFGAAGGMGGTVDANVTGTLLASGLGASGLVAQSLGGGGGNGGVNISGGISAGTGSTVPAVAFGLGGTGGDGSAGGAVTATHSGAVSVSGASSRGIFAQSVGGGGGNGGFNVAAALGTAKNFNLAIGVGGSGGAGSTGGVVTVNSDGQIVVDARDPDGMADTIKGRGAGLLAQSIGGGGGNAGFNVAGAGTNMGAPLTLGIGGSGAAGGMAGDVTVNRGLNNASLIQLDQDGDTGLFAQSIGGGGGNAGGNLVLSASLRARFDVQLAIGGAGGTGGDGGAVTVNHEGDIAMVGDNARGLVAQSIGGGGGDAGMNINLSLVGNRTLMSGQAAGTKTVDLQIGGAPGEGSDGGIVIVDHNGVITTAGDTSTAILAQSIGGGGGNAAEAISQNFNDQGALAVALGRIGGTGGLGGDVTVTTDGMISTDGASSYAVHAQSIGGGGGNSSTTTVSVEGDRSSQSGANQETATQSYNVEFALGLEGGEGAASGVVTVDQRGLIETRGAGAHGVYAQSIGGGGGNGGAAVIDRFSEIPNPIPGDDDAEGEYSLAVQIGGAGGIGAVGNTVSVDNSGTILTFGEDANAIRALSIGGGGGDAGAAFNVETPGKNDSYSLGFAFGGMGGMGALGGAVEVSNLGTLQTSGDNAAAIFAQSIGGGGGNAGLAGNFSKLSPTGSSTGVTIDYNQGGEGGTGGAAGAVTVSNGSAADTTAQILTRGERSHGIFAQSIGGGGGNGGSTLSGNFANGSNAYQLSVNIGGKGGFGGIGGLVTVDNFAVIETLGKEAHGIFAQSIGGGGGNGGLSLALGNLYAKRAFPAQALIAVGGAGGDGNDAGDVVVTNSGSIITRGDDAHGIFAQSLGGGGGNMSIGLGLTFNPAVNAGVNFLSNTVGFLLGAQPGDGGLGGEVTVTNTGNITVFGDGAHGILAESINGGGGGLTIDMSSIAGFVSGDLLPGFLGIEPLSDLPALTLFGGAAGQGDANADKVTINSTGKIRIVGNGGAGSSLQAIGGGGGRIVANLQFTEQQDERAVALPIQTGLGGSDSNGVAGGDLESIQMGDTITEGANTPGVLLQSVGGGGGRSIFSILAGAGQVGAVDLAFGATNLASASGGAITHRQAGDVVTLGTNSAALLAQSIGGGGGLTDFTFTLREPSSVTTTASLAGTKTVQETRLERIATAGPAAPGSPVANVAIGATGGSALNGGAITVTEIGNTMSAGHASPAVLFQSVGAGGGVLNTTGLAIDTLTVGASGDASGNGGAISLDHQGMIMTEGASSHGVILQSIGGGGGAVFGLNEGATVALSAENSGSGGAVSFTQTGNIVTMGEGASALIVQSLGGGGGFVDGAFAGSAGGAGAGGAIDVMLDGDVVSMSAGTTAIVLQSLGADGTGPITLTLNQDRTIFASAGGIAIEFDGGSDNLFTNRGTVTTEDGLAGTVLRGSGGNDAIQNQGMIMGNFALGGGINSLTNAAGATLLSGTSIDLGGAQSLVSNSGTLAPGGIDTIAQSAVNASLEQAADGMAFFEVDASTDVFDALNASGTVNLAGGVDVRLLNPTDFTPGMKNYQIITGDGGVTLSEVDLRADSSVVLNLLGIEATGNAIELQYDMTFAPIEASGNQQAVGEYLNRVQAAGISAELQPTFDQLVFEQDTAVYVDLLTQLGADVFAEQDAVAIGLAQDFGEAMANCGPYAGPGGNTDEQGCAWAEVRFSDGSRDALPGSPAIDSDSVSFSGGARYAVGENIALALAVGYDDLDMTGFAGGWEAQGEAIQLGGGVIYSLGATEFAAFASYGETSFDTTRQLAGFGSSAVSSRDVEMLSAQVGATHRFDFGDFTIKPGLALGLTSLGGGDTVEQGATPNNLALGQSGGTFTWAMPEVTASYAVSFADGWQARPYLNVALRQYLSDPVVTVSATFAADTSNVDPFLASAPLGRSHFAGEAGFEFANKGGIRFGASYRLDRASDRSKDGGRVFVAIPF